jgi:bacterioferritin-associated ferredoxin
LKFQTCHRRRILQSKGYTSNVYDNIHVCTYIHNLMKSNIKYVFPHCGIVTQCGACQASKERMIKLLVCKEIITQTEPDIAKNVGLYMYIITTNKGFCFSDGLFVRESLTLRCFISAGAPLSIPIGLLGFYRPLFATIGLSAPIGPGTLTTGGRFINRSW